MYMFFFQIDDKIMFYEYVFFKLMIRLAFSISFIQIDDRIMFYKSILFQLMIRLGFMSMFY